MRNDITLEVKGKEAFQLFYQGKEPQTVAKVANRLASLFIEENLKMREDLAEGTTSFLDRELARVKKQLELQEEAVRQFKVENMGALPEQIDANLRTLEQLQLQLQTVTVSLQGARESRRMLQNQANTFASMESQFDSDFVDLDYDDGYDPTLMELQEQLAALKVKYTDKHPDVVRIKSIIEKVEAEAQIEEDSAVEITSVDNEGTEFSDGGFSYADTMSLELESIDQEIHRLIEEQSKIKEKLALYQKRIEDTPKKEQELLRLQRDYANIQKNYESLLDKRLNAQIAANMERMQKGERFKILDPARVPEKPFKPNRTLIVLVAVFLGIGCGVALSFGLEYLDQSFCDVNDLEQYTGLSVMASIPFIVTEDDLVRKKRRRKIAFALAGGSVLILISLVVIQLFIFDFRSLTG